MRGEKMLSAKRAVETAILFLGLPYRWGGDFTAPKDLVTPENVRKWKLWHPLHFSAAKCKILIEKHLGEVAGDCSGLISKILDLPKTGSWMLWARCVHKVRITSRTKIPNTPGLIFYRWGHIGIGDGEGNVIESGSTYYGVTKTKIDSPQTLKAWTHYGRLEKYISYPVCPYITPIQQYPYRWHITGNDARWYQWHLQAKGYDCGCVSNLDEYGTDGKAFNKTWDAIEAEQSIHIGRTGAAGPQTRDAVMY
jgi:hypothetical protein